MERKIDKLMSIARSGSPMSIALRKLRHDWIAVASFLFIAIVALIAILGYLVTPDSTPFANNQHVELAACKPGFKVKMMLVRKQKEVKQRSLVGRMFLGQESAFNEISIDSVSFDGIDIIAWQYNPDMEAEPTSQRICIVNALYHLASDAAMLKSGNSVTFQLFNGEKQSSTLADLKDKFLSENIITRRFVLGTDRFGRDLLSRMIIGARVSLSVGFIAVFIALIIGIFMGSVAGFMRGWVDSFVMWLVNVAWSVPTLLMVIALTMLIGKGFWQIFIAVGLTMWVDMARVVRGQVLSVREKGYVEAATVLGFNKLRIIFKHVLPSVIGPVIIVSASNFATAILLEAGLSFLGVGVQPPMPSWGTIVRNHYGYVIMDKAYLALIPGFAIMLLVLAFNLLGNSLRDALDPKEVENR